MQEKAKSVRLGPCGSHTSSQHMGRNPCSGVGCWWEPMGYRGGGGAGGDTVGGDTSGMSRVKQGTEGNCIVR